MWEISIAVSNKDKACLRNIKDDFLSHFDFRDMIIAETSSSNMSYLSMATNHASGRMKKYLRFKLAQVIVVNYKTKFFKSWLNGLKYSKETIDTIMHTLVEYLIDEDINFAYDRINLSNNFVIDSFYHFRLKILTYKWKNICDMVKIGVY